VNTGTELVVAVEVVGTGVPVGPTEVVIVVVPFPGGVTTMVLEVVEVTVVVEVMEVEVGEVVDPALLAGEVMKGG